MRTRRSISMAWASASERPFFWWIITASAIWSPIVSTGLSEVIGSWKIMAIRLPRISRISASERASRSRPSNRTAPETTRPSLAGSRRIMDSAVTLLPQPDSPTIPTVSPACTDRLTPSTARVMPSSVTNWVRRSSTRRSASTMSHPPGEARIEPVAQPVAHQVDREHGQREAGAGKKDRPGRARQEQPARGDHVAPSRDLRWHARAQEREPGLGEDGRGHDVCGLDDERRDRAGQDVAQDDLAVPAAAADRGLDVGLLARGQHHRAHEPDHAGDLGYRDRHDDNADAGPVERDQ